MLVLPIPRYLAVTTAARLILWPHPAQTACEEKPLLHRVLPLVQLGLQTQHLNVHASDELFFPPPEVTAESKARNLPAFCS